MKQKPISQLQYQIASTRMLSRPARAVVPRLRDEGGFVNLRALLGAVGFVMGVSLALFAAANPQVSGRDHQRQSRPAAAGPAR